MTVSQATKFLEDAFDVLNKEYFENALPKPIITIQSSPKTNGHFTTQEVWKDAQRKRSFYEINLSAERLNRPIANTIATLIHEMVHYYCQLNSMGRSACLRYSRSSAVSAGCCPALVRWGNQYVQPCRSLYAPLALQN